MTRVIQELRRITGLCVAENEPMAPRTTLGVGGPADFFVEVAGCGELAELMKYISATDLPWMVLGEGANVLVSDKGIRGVVIHLTGDFKKTTVSGTTITAGSGARVSEVADIAARHNLSGLEGVGTVPGTVGGAIVMNAGTHRGYVDQVLESLAVVTREGEERVLSNEHCDFTYRGSRFQNDSSMLITSATFALRPGDAGEIGEYLESVRRRRAQIQPRGNSAGCFFKNPPDAGVGAGKLIELAGCKGLKQGGAVVSDVHANFMINRNKATASDLFRLAEKVRQTVRDKHGVMLEYEVRLVGEWEHLSAN